ncbi:MAG: signal peptide peptidase SppA [Rubrobacter sp.]|nr:signal peptide peptidase SppA [Rubrobacter sp.]
MASEASEAHGGETRGRGRSPWLWVILVLGVLFVLTVGLVVLVVAVSAGGNGDTAGSSAERASWEEVYVSGEGADRIAVVPVVGAIAAGEGGLLGDQTASPEALRAQLDQAADDDSVRAVILEVDSPGGGVVPSDVMHQEVVRFMEENEKPLVVSMGSTAASGGYYISAPADRILANRSTMTGSIGVVFPYTNFEEALDDFGIDYDPLTSGEFKDLASPADELTDEEREILQSQIEDSYDQFVGVIAEGRDLPEERVREIGDGRTYTGSQAEEIGLVDELGNLEDAARASRELADLEEAEVFRYEPRQGLLSSLQARLVPRPPEALEALRAAGLDPSPELQYLYQAGL